MVKEIDDQRDVMISHLNHEKDALLFKTTSAIQNYFEANKQMASSIQSFQLTPIPPLPNFVATYETFEPKSIKSSGDDHTSAPPATNQPGSRQSQHILVPPQIPPQTSNPPSQHVTPQVTSQLNNPHAAPHSTPHAAPLILPQPNRQLRPQVILPPRNPLNPLNPLPTPLRRSASGGAPTKHSTQLPQPTSSQPTQQPQPTPSQSTQQPQPTLSQPKDQNVWEEYTTPGKASILFNWC